MKNYEVHELVDGVHELVDGWVGQAATLAEAIAMRDELLTEPGHEVKIMAEVDESDLATVAERDAWKAHAERLYEELVIVRRYVGSLPGELAEHYAHRQLSIDLVHTALIAEYGGAS